MTSMEAVNNDKFRSLTENVGAFRVKEKTLLCPEMNRLGSHLIAATFRGFGVNAVVMETYAGLDLGKEFTSGKECFPCQVTVGDILLYLKKEKEKLGKNFDPETGLARVKNGDKWAYVNKAGEVSYINDSDIYEDFFNGLARGKKGEKFGFYNSKMEWAIPAQFDGARDFKNGYAAVKKGELWGVIDTTGKMIIEPKFEDIKDVEVIR